MCDTCTWKHRKVNSTKAKTITRAGETKYTTSFLSSYTVVYLGLPSSLKHNPKVSGFLCSGHLLSTVQNQIFSRAEIPSSIFFTQLALQTQLLDIRPLPIFSLLYSYPTPENLAGFVLGGCQMKAIGPVNRTCIKVPVWFISLLSS